MAKQVQPNGQTFDSKANSGKSNQGAGLATPEEVVELVAQLLGDDVFHDALFRMREGKPGWEYKVRETLEVRCTALLGVGVIASQLENVHSKLDALKADLDNYHSRVEQRVADLLPDGDLKKRFESEYPDEKRRIAEYVSATYFSAPQKCFLQASTFLLHLAEALRATGSGRGSVIHTNSTVFPWLMLGRGSKYSVYACCGHIHDPLCCGWLFSSNDTEAQNYVETLFTRTNDTLTTAFVTPQHLTLDGRLHFAMEATSELVEVLVKSSPKVVVLCPAQRIRRIDSELDTRNHAWHSVDFQQHRRDHGSSRDIQFVLAGELADGLQPNDINSLGTVGEVKHLV